MDVRVVIGRGDAAFADAVFAMCERTAEPLSLSLSVAHAPERQSFIAALEAMEAKAYVLTPPEDIQLQSYFEARAGFSVEVQPENITASGQQSCGTDAQIFGLGMSGYQAALTLLAERTE